VVSLYFKLPNYIVSVTDARADDNERYALVEFTGEQCTAVVPLQRVFGSEIKPGGRVSVLWNNRKHYSAIFHLSGNRL